MDDVEPPAAYAISSEDRLSSLADFLGDLVSAAGVETDSMAPEAMVVSEIRLDLPFELDLLEEQGAWQLDAGPPTQWIETSVMPVWHRLRIKVSLDNGERSLDTVES